ncbi:hypothetical protein RP300_02319 [Oligella urethralis]|uniref:hypothetical protein n=1 Tax=Oligella TaxID=90243 RepID=UPI00065F84BE|nr:MULTISPECIES: hypothetical protein [Oligella]OFS81945.1 hypothetical protein HMPREF3144_11230 [Oligella sp. HMSC05A10]OFV48787.1 hypothetical protein HMPREF3179_05480 [Oligella sp. HMSC09E12]PMC17009.1 hypothetical protein CJ230_07590 [Oligella urethralis]WOS38738.1 hypothetical protein RP300_02319 [Oligella urethralis]
MKVLKFFIFFTLTFCLQGFLFNWLLFDALPIMPMWLRLLPFYISKVLFSTKEGLLYPEVTDFVTVIFFNLINTLLICFVLYSLCSLLKKQCFVNQTPKNIACVLQNKKYLIFNLLVILVFIQLFLFYFFPTFWFEHPDWLKSTVASFKSPIYEVIGFLCVFLSSLFNALIFLLAIDGFYRLFLSDDPPKSIGQA